MDVCRFCLDTERDSGQPFITPCVCKGSVKYIHSSCLKKWVIADETYIEERLLCSICKTPFQLAPLETIPPRIGYTLTILNNGLLVTTVHEYAYLLYVTVWKIPGPYDRGVVTIHACMMLLYAFLMWLNFDVRNMGMYRSMYIGGHRWIVPCLHVALLVECYNNGTFNSFFISKLLIQFYWMEHVRILKKINEAIVAP